MRRVRKGCGRCRAMQVAQEHRSSQELAERRTSSTEVQTELNEAFRRKTWIRARPMVKMRLSFAGTSGRVRLILTAGRQAAYRGLRLDGIAFSGPIDGLFAGPTPCPLDAPFAL